MQTTYCAQTAQKKIAAHWDSIQAFAYQPHDTQRPVYSIDTPPPTVSGSLHIGHLFSYTHTDFLARFHRMNGANVYYPMGFDDNGLPTERFVEKKHKTKAHIVGRSGFIKLCLEEVAHAHKTFSDLWKSVGLSIDWNFTYSTISDRARTVAQKNFLELFAQNNVYQAADAALYCTTCQTSVAQAELDSMEQKTIFNTILFADEKGSQYPVATTRPELLPACVAVLFHPDDTRYNHLAGTTLKTPFFDKPVPCFADEDVLQDKGTGLVMCCTFGDQTDIVWFKRHKLPLITAMNEYGVWHENTGPMAGKKVAEARKAIVATLQEAGLLTEQKNIANQVNIHERCKQPIEFRIINQWFVKLIENKEAFLNRANEIAWRPEYMQSRYNDWVSNLQWDWCISRQRFFGVPIPVWHCLDCNAVLTPPTETLPIDPTEAAFPGGSCSCGSTNLKGETDVMDTWNISSLTPRINQALVKEQTNGSAELPLPFSLRPQAHDIIRTWAFYTIAKAHYTANTIPWKSIVISGHVTQGSGKISKSSGGAAWTPEALLEKYSADALRYWAAKGNPGVDTAFSEEQLKMGGRLQTKLWNALRFIKMATEGASFEQARHDVIDSWLHERLEATRYQYAKSFEKAEYARALEALDSFFWHDLCDNYLELVKDRLNNPERYDAAIVAGSKKTLFEIGLQVIHLYCPFVPFVTESIYQEMYANCMTDKSLSTMQFAAFPTSAPHTPSTTAVNELLHVVSEVRRLKSEAKKSLKEPLATLTITPSSEAAAATLTALHATITGITKAHECSFVQASGTTTTVTVAFVQDEA